MSLRLLPHPYSETIPAQTPFEFAELLADIKAHGQRDAIVLFEGMILDGRHRERACYELGIQPIFEIFDPARHGDSPLDFVVSKNLRRRNLTPGQRAAAAVRLKPLYAAEAREAQRAGGRKNGGDTRGKSKTEPAAMVNRTRAPAAVTRAAQAVGVSDASVKVADRISKTAPELFVRIQRGEIKLHTAAAEALHQEDEVVEAVATIARICGRPMAESVREGKCLKSKSEILTYVALGEREMKKCRGMILSGARVKEAVNYQIGPLCRTHTIGDLCKRTSVQESVFSLEVTIGVNRFSITCEKVA